MARKKIASNSRANQPIDPPAPSPSPAPAAEPMLHERKVHFRRLMDTEKRPKTTNWPEVAASLERLPIEDRTVDDTSGNCVQLHVHSTSYPIRLVMTTSREKAIPCLVNRTGSRRPIAARADEGVGEDTHLVVMRDGTIVAEYNHHGPRASFLFRFLARVMPENAMAGTEFGTGSCKFDHPERRNLSGNDEGSSRSIACDQIPKHYRWR